MTDEERENFVAELKDVSSWLEEEGEPEWTGDLCAKAAEEIERLAKENERLQRELQSVIALLYQKNEEEPQHD